jgi:site-specific DNA-methyltransferase (adenine-specific)
MEFTKENIKLICADNMKIMAQYPDNYFDLVVADPPYGLGNRLSDGGGKLKNTPMSKLYRGKDWDVLPNKDYWIQLFRVSKNQIVFGANYFMEYLPSSRGFVCWDKKQAMPTLSSCELVWTSLDRPSKIYRKQSKDLNRFHPTQKPVKLYDFCFDYVKAKKDWKILDPNFGSASSAISAYYFGFAEYVGIEIDKDYFDSAVKRFKIETSQNKIF